MMNSNLIFSVFILSAFGIEAGASTGKWTVENKDGGVCMKMEMSGTLTIPYTTSSGQPDYAFVNIPNTASSSASKCDDDNLVEFRLGFFTDWELFLKYHKQESTYKLIVVGVKYTIDNHFPNAISNDSKTVSTGGSYLPTTKIGSYDGCNQYSFDLSEVTLDLDNVKFQPFVQSVSDNGYGEMEPCSSCLIYNEEMWRIKDYVILSLSIALTLTVTISCGVYCCNNSKNSFCCFNCSC